ncbi:MAG TPA: hypothetical protein VD994_06970 [Prosthecobacter sp.]|nr:hypothetical protein [Prosthecobacter sp.]
MNPRPSASVPALILSALLSAIALAASAPAVEPPPVSFHELRTGETIHARLDSQGCIHDTTHHLQFLGGQAKLVTIFRDDGRPQPTRLGTLPISDAEAAALDRLVTFYRTCRISGCTTVDKIAITQTKAAAQVTRENFIDGTCATMDEKAWPTTLWTLITRLTPRPTKQQSAPQKE